MNLISLAVNCRLFILHLHLNCLGSLHHTTGKQIWAWAEELQLRSELHDREQMGQSSGAPHADYLHLVAVTPKIKLLFSSATLGLMML